MLTSRLRLTAVPLLTCAALALAGCSSADAPANDLGPGVITPGVAGGEVPSASAPASASASPSASTGPRASAGGAPAVAAPFRDGDAELEADNQSGAGRSVRIEEAQLRRSNGFVAVYALDSERLLGSVAVPRTSDDDDDDRGGDDDDDSNDDDDDDDGAVTVRLSRALTETTRLLVVLHADNGDRRFDAAEDPRVAGDDDGELEVDRITYRVR